MQCSDMNHVMYSCVGKKTTYKLAIIILPSSVQVPALALLSLSKSFNAALVDWFSLVEIEATLAYTKVDQNHDSAFKSVFCKKTS